MNNIIYKCKNCQGGLVFDPKTQKLVCEWCGSAFEESDFESDELKVGTQENAYGATPTETQDGMLCYTCSTCKGEIIADKTTTATFCVFCGNNTILSSQLKDEFLPKRIVGFSQTEKQAKAAFLQECKKRPLCPPAFKSTDNIEKIKGVYVPFYVYDVDAAGRVQMAATRTTTSTHGDTVTEKTAHYNVIRAGNLPIVGLPADASEKMDDAFMESIEPFDITEAKPYSNAFLSGFFAERNDVEETDCYDRISKRIEASVVSALKNTANGYHTVTVMNENVNLNVNNNDLTMLPVYMLNTKYNNEIYTFAMNGQTGKLIGKFPISKALAFKRFAITSGILYAVFAAVGLLINLL